VKIALAASIASLLLAGGCQAAAGLSDQPGEVVGQRDGETRLRLGQTLIIALPSNASTGYQWTVSGADGGVLVPSTPFGERVTEPHAPGMVGVGGVSRWRFTATRSGVATLRFDYRRPWEGDMPPAQTAVFQIAVH